ncbi:16S rRNA (guanine(966)-N(2))-methyltransferase RsmD [Desulfocurvus sp.]|jgi:16S rRNA (guanine966-N2)-methyltransferase|uniref:16S rRNA (guanine(966)-N(2))-methyltransferase RsmD n=1 Tax=Desulfocurvus sp. TaxID=2871698 RepID=UPI0025BE1B3B|nr:16S rRNA (guanine(966)-N(2))-methyltransferase RsmD [Desulfocurvus sp.]MCK9240253.1 16S rRNA (guanine(966)-N(2))-methyltransferase RsmD [Desulfocurvus sp.]
MRLVSGQFGGREIRSVCGPGYRPATSKVRQAVFSMLEARGVRWPGLRVLDLFAGTGSLALEALSRGAAFAAFVEKNRKAAAAIQGTLKDLGLGADRARVHAADLFALLKGRPDAPFDVLFVDPPYGQGLLLPALELALACGWVAPQAVVLAEVEARLELDPGAAHPSLAPLADKTYGQTRILAWTNSAA